MPHGSPTRADFPTRLSVDEARARVVALAAARRLPAESVVLEHALGRILASDLVVPLDVPPFANSAMDGYALRGADLAGDGEQRLRIAARILAGDRGEHALAAGECASIMTGAPLPAGADTVVIKENVRVDDGCIVVATRTPTGANVRPAGEDFRRGDIGAHAGTALDAARLAVLAACGQARASVARRPRVALFVTGDELVPPTQALAHGQIHDSNRYSLGGMLRELGIEPDPVAHLRDDPDALREALLDAATRCDVVVSSGGVSAGDADYLPQLVAGLGEVHFWKVRMKPGMPVLCGRIGTALVLALPGNPVSTMVTFELLVRPALLALQGAASAPPDRCSARLDRDLVKRHDRAEFLRGRVEWRDNGVCWIAPLPQQGSGMLRGIAEADALIALPEGARSFARGDVVTFLPLPGFAR